MLVRRWWLAGVIAMSVGCGSELYQQRLQETVDYLEYQERINRELGPQWSGKNIRFQPPSQFELMPAPLVPGDGQHDAGEVTWVDPSDDPRQPHYLGIELPGLVAAWEAQVDADTGDGQARHTAHLYLLSNYDLYLQQQEGLRGAGDPDHLIADFENGICRAIGVVLPEGDNGSGNVSNSRYREKVPKGLPNSKYQSPQEFTAIRLSPEYAVTDVPVEMQVYEWSGSRIQIVIVMVSPVGLSPHEALHDRLLLALETFRASDQFPTGPGSTSSGGESPGGRRGSSF